MRFSLSWPRRVTGRRRGPLRRRDRLGCGVHAAGLHGLELFERRVALAADLAVSVFEADAWYVPGSQTSITFDLVNKGDATATGAQFTSSLSGQITSPNWKATYAGGATGPASGFGAIGATVTMPAGGSARFTITGAIGANATGALVNSANASLAGDGNTADNTAVATLRFVPKSVVATNDAAYASTSIVRLLDPATGGTRTTAFAFEPGFKGGVRTAVGDLDGDGKPEIVATPGVGRVAEVVVLRQEVSDSGAVTLVKDPRYSLAPFGSGERRGIAVAVADFNADGRDDIAFARSSGAGEVRVYHATAAGGLAFAKAFTPSIPGNFTGVSLSAADFGTFASGAVVDASRPDGKAELVVASGAGVAPLVQVVDLSAATPAVVDSIRPFAAAFRGGLSVSTGRVDPDATPDIIVAQGQGGTSQVEIYDGRVGSATNALLAPAFTAFAAQPAASRRGPVTTAGIDIDGDARIDSIQMSQASAVGTAVQQVSVLGAPKGSTTSGAGATRVASAESRLVNDVQSAVFQATASGLKFRDVIVGTGVSPSSASATVKVDYEGRLIDGTKFDGNTGTSFNLSGVVAGFREGIQSMKVGGRRILVIPANLAYGANPPAGSSIPANATLVFDVALLETT